jgi:hypothetical protein
LSDDRKSGELHLVGVVAFDIVSSSFNS